MDKIETNRVNSIVIRLFSLMLILISSTSWAFETQEDGFWHDLQYRTFKYYIPTGLTGPAPLIVDLHGFGSSASEQKNANDGYIQQLADREGIVLVFPEAVTFPTSWNGDACCFPAAALGVRDRDFIKHVVDRMKSTVAIDPIRIYAMGISNGGIMSHRLGIQSSNLFAAIAPVSFQLTNNITWHIPSSWGPDRAVPQIEFHALDDDFIFYNGGVILGSYPALLDSAPKGRDTWGDINDCEGSPRRENHPTAVGAYRDIYDDCAEDTSVQLFTVATGGHSGLLQPELNGGFSTHEEQWAFLSQYSKPGHEGDQIWEGQKLRPGEWIQSRDGQTRMTLENNGDIRLVKNGSLLWNSGTANEGADKLVMQRDGNLVLYRDGYWGWRGIFWVYHNPKVLWASNTVGSGESRLQVNNSGSLQVLRDNSVDWQEQ